MHQRRKLQARTNGYHDLFSQCKLTLNQKSHHPEEKQMNNEDEPRGHQEDVHDTREETGLA